MLRSRVAVERDGKGRKDYIKDSVMERGTVSRVQLWKEGPLKE